MGKVRKPNQPLSAAAAAASAAAGSTGADTADDADAVTTASTSKSARVSEVKKCCSESTCCGKSWRVDGSTAKSFDDDDDSRKDAGGANDAAGDAKSATVRAWNFMANIMLCSLVHYYY